MRVDVFIGHALLVGALLYFLSAFAYVSLLSFVDVVGFLFVVLAPLYLLMATHGYKATMGAVRLGLIWYKTSPPAGFESDSFREGAYLIQTVQRLTWGCALIYSLFQSYELLVWMGRTDWSNVSMAPAVGLCILPFLYASVMNWFVWVPLERFAQASYTFGRDQDMALVRMVTPPPPQHPSSFTTIAAGLFVLFVAGGSCGFLTSEFVQSLPPPMNADSSVQDNSKPDEASANKDVEP